MDMLCLFDVDDYFKIISLDNGELVRSGRMADSPESDCSSCSTREFDFRCSICDLSHKKKL